MLDLSCHRFARHPRLRRKSNTVVASLTQFVFRTRSVTQTINGWKAITFRIEKLSVYNQIVEDPFRNLATAHGPSASQYSSNGGPFAKRVIGHCSTTSQVPRLVL